MIEKTNLWHFKTARINSVESCQYVCTYILYVHTCLLFGKFAARFIRFHIFNECEKKRTFYREQKKMYVDQEMMPFKFGALSIWWLNIYSPDLTSFYCAYFHIDAGEILSVITHLVANSLFVLILAPRAHTNKRTQRTKITITITTVAIAASCTIEFKQNESTMRAK